MSTHPRYFDRRGQPIDLVAWCAAMEDPQQKRVALTQIGNVEVSTVWLGLDHAFYEGAPLIFETMVFGGVLDEECERYSTEAEAIAGHHTMCARVREGLT
jgi:hypothetical protein